MPTYLVTAAQMQAAEVAANAAGLRYDDMMERAGTAVAEAIERQFGAGGIQVTVLVGPGNNGGDGLVAARRLVELGAAVQLYLWKRANLNDDLNWQRLQVYDLPVAAWDDDPNGEMLTDYLERSAVVVDALLGTGVSRPIEGGLAALLTQARAVIEARRQPDVPDLADPLEPLVVTEVGPVLVAVDLPSGLNADTGEVDPLTLPADLTVTFAAAKRGHVLWPGAGMIGQLLIADIGLDDASFAPDLPQLANPMDMADLLPMRAGSGHKGTFGKVMVVAGSLRYTGAPMLAGEAAGRAGAGLVTVATGKTVHPIVAAGRPEATYLPLPDDGQSLVATAVPPLLAALPGYKALLLGPGLGHYPASEAFVLQLLAQAKSLPPLVLDADALNILATQPQWWENLPQQSILTPHPGEMSRLSGYSIAELEANRLTLVAELAQRWRQVVVYKGAFSIVAGPDEPPVVLPFANPALATAGSGDVLAGCITGLLAQGMPPQAAALTGTYVHGLAGEMARVSSGDAGVLAGDLPPLLGVAIAEIIQAIH